MIDNILDIITSGWGITILVVGFIGLLVFAVIASDKDVTRRCQHVMSLAITRRDTLDATIACEKLRDDNSRDWAIIGSGSRR